MSLCPQCGTRLPKRSLGGLCPRCVAWRLAAEQREAVPVAPQLDLSAPLAREEHPGTKLGRYTLAEKLGEGGCGVVYAAEQTEPVRRRVALKIIKLGMDTRAVVARFEAERQALAMMDHPGIAKVFDAGATDTGRPYFVMELVSGRRITDYCDEQWLDTRARLELFLLVCAAIQHAHQKGIIHRDLKPSNILVTMQDGAPAPKVIDFGIAKATEQTLGDATQLTAHHQFLGTPAYMSPEQAEMTAVDMDTRSDIYSLGVLLYELLCGVTPFDTEEFRRAGPDEMRRMIREIEPVRPSVKKSESSRTVPADLDCIVMQCLEKERARRYESVHALAEDLRRHLRHEPVSAGAPGAGYKFRKLVRRNRLAFAFAAVIAVVLVAATVISATQAVRAARAQAQAKNNLVISEAARQEAETMTKFLTEIFQSPDPKQDGRTVTVAETLGRAARRIETDLVDHPECQAKLRTTLASTYRALGLYQEATPLLEKVRDYRLATHGPGHSNTLDALRDLAVVYLDASRRTEALQLSETVLAGFRELYGPTHPKTLLAMSQVAWCRSVIPDYRGAITLEEQALKLSREVNGPEHADTLLAMGQLGWFYSLAQRPKQAFALQTELLRLKQDSLGPEHPDTLNTMTTLAVSQCQLGQHNEAIVSLQQTIALSQKVKGATHPETLWALGTLGETYESAGRHEEALKIYEEILATSREINGEKHGRTLWAVHRIAALQKKTREAGETQQRPPPSAPRQTSASPNDETR